MGVLLFVWTMILNSWDCFWTKFILDKGTTDVVLVLALDVDPHSRDPLIFGPPSWSTVKAMLTLGTKYAADDLRLEAIIRFQNAQPRTVDAWDDISSGRTTPVITNEDADTIDMTNVALIHGLRRVYAYCLYDACQMDEVSLLEGIPLGNGQTSRLTPGDLLSCIRARNALICAHLGHLDDLLLLVPSLTCTQRDTCRVFMGELCSGIRGSHWPPLHDPMTVSQVDMRAQLEAAGLCSLCVTKAENAHKTWRQCLLDNMHKYFGQESLPSDDEVSVDPDTGEA